MNKILNITLSLAAVFSAASSLAEEPSSEFDFQLETGAQYDSTLTVIELDQVSGKSDWAALLNGRVGAKFRPTERLTLKGSYRYAARRYREYSQFDQDTHSLSLDGSVKLAGTSYGLSHNRASALLASERFLDLSKSSLYAGRLFDNGIYLRPAVSVVRKEFPTSTERNSEGAALAVDLYYFPNGAGSYWYLGLGGETEDARAARFDNRALSVSARYSHNFSNGDRDNKVQLGWRYLDRDYRHLDPELDAARQDQRQLLEASWTLGLSRYLELESGIEYGDYRSNLELADYRETSASVMLRADF